MVGGIGLTTFYDFYGWKHTSHKYNLVGGLEHFLFSHILGMSSSQLTFIFFRGVAQPPTSNNICLFVATYLYRGNRLFQRVTWAPTPRSIWVGLKIGALIGWSLSHHFPYKNIEVGDQGPSVVFLELSRLKCFRKSPCFFNRFWNYSVYECIGMHWQTFSDHGPDQAKKSNLRESYQSYLRIPIYLSTHTFIKLVCQKTVISPIQWPF